ncbi:hypothetical protein P4O66_021612, partial [Electrophorus voltai]
MLQTYLRRAKMMSKLRQEDAACPPQENVAAKQAAPRYKRKAKVYLKDAGRQQGATSEEKQQQGSLDNESTLPSKTSPSCSGETGRKDPASMGQKKTKQLNPPGSNKMGANDENGSRNEGERGQNGPGKRKKTMMRWKESAVATEEDEDAGWRRLPVKESSDETEEEEEQEVTVEDKGMEAIRGGGVETRGVGVPAKKKKIKEEVKEERVEVVVGKGGVETRDAGVPEKEVKKKKIKEEVKEERVEVVVGNGGVETRDAGVPEKEVKKKKIKKAVKEERVEVVVCKGGVETRDAGVPEKEVKKKKIKKGAKEKGVEMKSCVKGVETRDMGDPEKEVKKKKGKEEATEGRVEENKGEKRKKKGEEEARDAPPAEARRKRRRNETSAQVLEREKGEVPGETRCRKEKGKSKVERASAGEHVGGAPQGSTKTRVKLGGGDERARVAPEEIRETKRSEGGRKESCPGGSVEGRGEGEEELELSRELHSKKKKKKREELDGEPEHGGIKKKKKKKRKRNAVEERLGESVLEGGEGKKSAEEEGSVGSAGLSEEEGDVRRRRKKKEKAELKRTARESLTERTGGQEPEKKQKRKKENFPAENKGGCGRNPSVEGAKEHADDTQMMRKMKVKQEEETEEGQAADKRPNDIIFLSARPGNQDEVSIDQVKCQMMMQMTDHLTHKPQSNVPHCFQARRLALQREIDEESQPKANFGQWDTAHFDNSEKQIKFLRLMGGFKKGSQPIRQK